MIDLENKGEKLDRQDPLKEFRDKFHFPSIHEDLIYLNGNSLGLQPDITEEYVLKELKEWKDFGVEGHFKGDTPWLPYHELITPSLMKLAGAEENEVVVMNTLTANLHFLMVSFYKPTKTKYKILVEYSPFPSDLYAVKSQLDFHGFDSDIGLIELKPDQNEYVSREKIKKIIEDNKDELALIMMGGVNYYTGQTYDMEFICKLANKHEIPVGFDLAHGIGNIPLRLHDWGVDFAVFCTYKYLNSGPGSVGGAFVHNKHADKNLKRFAGWWGHDKETRFLMGDEFKPISGVEGWQLSNPPILSLAAIRASMKIFDNAGFSNLREKSIHLIRYARECLQPLSKYIKILTPNEELSGCQLSLVINKNAKEVHRKLNDKGIICDWREPNVIRIAFVPLYNRFDEVFKFSKQLHELVRSNEMPSED